MEVIKPSNRLHLNVEWIPDICLMVVHKSRDSGGFVNTREAINMDHHHQNQVQEDSVFC